MRWIGAVVAVALIAAALFDAFKAVIVPRRVSFGFLVRYFYRSAWKVWRLWTSALPLGRRRSALLGVFGPALLLSLLVLWAVELIAGFALLHWALGTQLRAGHGGFFEHLYFSGTTFFTLG